jgi:isopentenyl-diphosphate Delta-isomerase
MGPSARQPIGDVVRTPPMAQREPMAVSARSGATRKAEHLAIAAGAGVEHAASTGLDEVRLRHRALPERDLHDVSLETSLLGHTLRAPLLISAMTGGTPEAGELNHRLARAAARHGIGLTLGSGRQLLNDPELLGTYRGTGRPPLLLGNLGAAQIREPDGPAEAERLVAMLEADGLSIHLNPLQEAVQPEGEPRFSGVAARIAETVRRLAPLPVVVKEVGFGMDADDVALLRRAGVAAIDVAGSGGTNWALIEGRRDPRAGAIASGFADWGVSTCEALRNAVHQAGPLPVIASGGLRHGVDVARCVALGACAAAMARPLLLAARADRAAEVLHDVVRQLRVAVWLAGAPAVSALGAEHLR